MEKYKDQSISVLRLGHRPNRDKRVSTHLLLTARAFGASNAFYTGTQDDSLEESIRKVVKDWGGTFNVEYSDSWRKVVKSWDGKIVHLTMYGLPIQDLIGEIRLDPSPKLAVVGGAKVPGEVYGTAHWNIAITRQPHSEVSALAIFLHELYLGAELEFRFPDARLRVVSQAKGKKLETYPEKIT